MAISSNEIAKRLERFQSDFSQDYVVQCIGDGAYSVLDAGKASFYIVEGCSRAAVIDTGITVGGKIMPLIRSITDKPLLLLLTHAHVDHMHHMDEFRDCDVFLGAADADLPEDFLRPMCAGKDLIADIRGARKLKTGDIIDLGNNQLEVCIVPGHTPGSAVFLDRKNNLLFTGDAIGSGAGVWLQLEQSLPLEEYLRSLINLQKWLVDRGGRMKFWGGHSSQIFQSTLIPGYNPLGMGLLADLIDLVDGVVSGTIVGHRSNVDKFVGLEVPLYASYGRAELQYSPSNIHSKNDSGPSC